MRRTIAAHMPLTLLLAVLVQTVTAGAVADTATPAAVKGWLELALTVGATITGTLAMLRFVFWAHLCKGIRDEFRAELARDAATARTVEEHGRLIAEVRRDVDRVDARVSLVDSDTAGAIRDFGGKLEAFATTFTKEIAAHGILVARVEERVKAYTGEEKRSTRRRSTD